MTIGDYIKTIKIDQYPTIIDWNELLKNQGYYSVDFNAGQLNQNFQEVHLWCKKRFGDQHYVWTGSKMWFETDQAALIFSIKWL